MIFKPL